jgi:hypothetical protein
MTLLWTAQEMIEAMDGRPVGAVPDGVTGISIDSRTVGEGDAFFAIKGERFDGHDFASVAVANGASLLVVSESKLPALGRLTAPMIVVKDVLAALEDLGRAARERSEARIIAVTGSVGKTSSKEMLRHALEPSGAVHASAASFNNHWGVPLTLARMPVDTAYGVFEIGMNHPDEIRPLVKMVQVRMWRSSPPLPQPIWATSRILRRDRRGKVRDHGRRGGQRRPRPAQSRQREIWLAEEARIGEVGVENGAAIFRRACQGRLPACSIASSCPIARPSLPGSDSDEVVGQDRRTRPPPGAERARRARRRCNLPARISPRQAMRWPGISAEKGQRRAPRAFRSMAEVSS